MKIQKVFLIVLQFGQLVPELKTLVYLKALGNSKKKITYLSFSLRLKVKAKEAGAQNLAFVVRRAFLKISFPNPMGDNIIIDYISRFFCCVSVW